jgi:hypothetical protein
MLCRGSRPSIIRLCWLMRRAPDSKRWERDSSKALAGFLRALTIVFNANVESILELTNRVLSLDLSVAVKS